MKTKIIGTVFLCGAFSFFSLFSYYGYLPDYMSFYDAIALGAHDSQSLSEMGWRIPNQYGNFYDLMKLYGVRQIDLRVYLGTDEVAAEAPLKDVGNFFESLFTGKDVTKPRAKPLALITCHEHSDYDQNCSFTRLILKEGIPTKVDYFFQEVERFLSNNPNEFVVITLGTYIGSEMANYVNGWKGKSDQDIVNFLDNIIENSGITKRIISIPTKTTVVREVRGKVVILADVNAKNVTSRSRYVKNTVDMMFKTQGWNTFPNALKNNDCGLYLNNPSAKGLAINIQPTTPFDTSTSPEAIQSFTKVFAGSDFAMYNFATEVNTENNIRKMVNLCGELNNMKVNGISLDFVSKGTPKLPGAVIFEINKERAQGRPLLEPDYDNFIRSLK